jgi:hypothetical protein
MKHTPSYRLGPLEKPLLAHPAGWIALATVFVAVDFLAGPEVQFPIAFVFPVALAAWHRGFHWAAWFAVFQPAARFAFHFVWEDTWLLHLSSANLLIRVTVLSGFAWLVAHAARQRRHIQKLERLLPVCAWCKRIRDEQGGWQSLDGYLSEHSEMTFSHGICPDCLKNHFPEERPG